MKAILLLILMSAVQIASTFAQSPQSFSYQAVVRNSSGEIVTNTPVSLRISIRQNSQAGAILFKETHSATTNDFGAVTIQIGNGTPVSGSFSSIEWGDGISKFFQVEIDINGGSNFTQMGTSQLLSVPYSLNSEKTSGFRVLTSQQRDAISSPEMGMALFNSDTRKINYHDGYGWLEITGVRQADFTCGNPLLDSRDGTYYSTVEIGGQCWMAENINFGTMLQGTSNSSDNGIVEKYCYSNNPGLCDTYGALYQWNEMMSYSNTEGVQGICPEEWHIPTDTEWNTLINAAGGPTNAGTNLVEGGSSGFEALMGGYRKAQLTGYPFGFIGSKAYFWTSSQVNSSIAHSWYLIHNDPQAYTETHDNLVGYSVRCVKD
jgi:uncharacterized protein (TIGR02145 family)